MRDPERALPMLFAKLLEFCIAGYREKHRLLLLLHLDMLHVCCHSSPYLFRPGTQMSLEAGWADACHS